MAFANTAILDFSDLYHEKRISKITQLDKPKIVREIFLK